MTTEAMRVGIVSRIFAPEASAASFRLAALAAMFAERGSDVDVLTTLPPQRQRVEQDPDGVRVRRFPVLRDKTGYVRGYLQYMSFDIPAFFRVLFGRKRDLLVIEPPPTTGFFVMLAAKLRRTPYAYYAADVWSDASESTGAPGFVVRTVRWLEANAMRSAQTVLSVNEGVSDRVRQIAPGARVVTVGNGVDTTIFTPDGPQQEHGRFFVYSGTASEWQGAGVFIHAFARIAQQHPDVRIVFLGQGSDWPALQKLADDVLPNRVDFVPTVPPEEAAGWLRGAVASLASIKPESGYDFAFPTKVFASWAAGTPTIYAGTGPVHAYMEQRSTEAELGAACDFDEAQIAAAMDSILVRGADPVRRHRLGTWAAHNVSLRAVAERAADALGVVRL